MSISSVFCRENSFSSFKLIYQKINYPIIIFAQEWEIRAIADTNCNASHTIMFWKKELLNTDHGQPLDQNKRVFNSRNKTHRRAK